MAQKLDPLNLERAWRLNSIPLGSSGEPIWNYLETIWSHSQGSFCATATQRCAKLSLHPATHWSKVESLTPPASLEPALKSCNRNTH